jgi:nucleoside-diphosphate-sugar epimerase
MKTILLTGITGFLGSNLLEAFLEDNYKVIGVKRSASDVWKIREFYSDSNLQLIDADKVTIGDIFANYNIDFVVHAAWSGVKAEQRSSFQIQLENFDLSATLFTHAIKAKVSKIIAFGSQAEYGHYEGRVDENHPCNPTDAYGMTKVFASRLLQTLAEQSNVKWNWIRLFSLYGPKEDDGWLLPFAIKRMLNNDDIDLTECEQRYDYLYVKDFCKGIILVLKSEISGIYNLSSNRSIKLREILLTIKDISNSKSNLNFGALSYRKNQVMRMEGDSTKFYSAFNFNPETELKYSLAQTISFYKKCVNGNKT